MFIDIHVHLTPRRSVLAADGSTFTTPEELLTMLDKAGIDKAVVLPSVNPEGGHIVQSIEEILAVCEQYPERFIPFCNLDPRLENNSPTRDFSRELTYYKEVGCKGVGEICANLPFDDPRVENLFRQCEAFGMPVDFHVGPQVGNCYGLVDDPGLPRLEGALKKFPNLLFFGHSQPFWAEIGPVAVEDRNRYPKGKVLQGGRVPELLRRYPNLYGDLSAGSGFNAVSRDPEFGYEFFETFQDRLFFGTDICAPHNDTPLVGFLRDAADTGKISREAFKKITWRNADRVLGLGL